MLIHLVVVVIAVNTITGGGVDYVSGPYTVRFSAGQTTSDSFNIALNADGLQEGNENFNLVIVLTSLPANVTRGTTNSQATVTIVDDECKCQQYISILHQLILPKLLLV